MRAVRDPLLDRMLEAGLARIDRHGFGLDATERLDSLEQTARLSWGCGASAPSCAGSFWECTAVPDIRADAQRLAGIIGQQVGE